MSDAELIIDAKPAPGSSTDSGGGAMAPIAVPVLAAGMLAKFVSPTAALAALGVGVAAFIVRWKPHRGRFILRVKDGTVEIARERGNDPPTSFLLVELLDVTLERKTTQATGGATERVRIALDRRDADPILVPESPITPIEAQEWVGKVRVFLRKHAWLPQDERPAADEHA